MTQDDGRWQLRFEFAATPSAGAPVRNSPASEKREPVLRLGKRTALPVPKPLGESITAGHFGHDEQGRPIRPSRQEVREITETHSERLRQAVIDGHTEAFEQGVAKYAESFGGPAAQRLQSYVYRLARESSALGRKR